MSRNSYFGGRYDNRRPNYGWGGASSRPGGGNQSGHAQGSGQLFGSGQAGRGQRGYVNRGGHNSGQVQRGSTPTTDLQGPFRRIGTLLTNHYAIDLLPPRAPPSSPSKAKPATKTDSSVNLYRYTFPAPVRIDKKESESKTRDTAKPDSDDLTAMSNLSLRDSPQGKFPARKNARQSIRSTKSSNASPKTSQNAKSSSSRKSTSAYTPSAAPQPSGDPSADAGEQGPSGSLSPKTLRRLVYLLVRKLEADPAMGGMTVASDYNSFLVTSRPIPAQVLRIPHAVILYGDHEHLEGSAPKFEFLVGDEKRISLTELQNALVKYTLPQYETPAWITERDNAIRALNIVLTHTANIKTFADGPRGIVKDVARIRSKKFFDIQFRDQGHPDKPAVGPWEMLTESELGLEARKGFFVSTRASKGPAGRLLLNINPTTSAFYRHDGNMIDFYDYFRDPNLNLSIGRIDGMLEGLRVRTNYFKDQGRTEKEHVFLSFGNRQGRVLRANAASFTLDGSPKTVYQYFADTYPFLKVAGDELVVSVKRGRDPILVPARLLDVTPGQFCKRKTDLIRWARKTPAENKRLIETFGNRIFGLFDSPVSRSLFDGQHS
jgi:hypothetical protein